MRIKVSYGLHDAILVAEAGRNTHISSGMLPEKFTRTLCEWEDRLFELRAGLDIGGIIPGEALESDRSEWVLHAHAYHAVW